ncbi:MAG: 16S rRNA (guanine(527)-N(7))-methyltransferase RsmG [Eubacterium sp.]|nr:16S rRNA (guanine(527)-N(7))-methyltransferase RsmG [Eubacterium sp.]
MSNTEKLISAGAQCGIRITEAQSAKMIAYMEALLDANSRVNVTRITDEDEFIEKHLIDSLTALKYIADDAQTILDVGTGGGFPGVPLAIMRPQAQVTLMDATGKKLRVIEEICRDIGVDNVAVLHGRAEEFGKSPEYREVYDCVVSRAVANLGILSELCLPLVKVGGSFLALKGKNYQEEMAAGRQAIAGLGGKIKAVEDCLLLQTDLVHVIIWVDKISRTPEKYPRSFGQMKKKGFPG